MIVYKFGGASVKCAEAVRNVLKIIKLCDSELVVVVSAMGKMTNAFEKLLNNYFQKEKYANEFDFIKKYHFKIAKELFKDHKILQKIEKLFDSLEKKLEAPVSENYDKEYDEIIRYGELLSSLIISEFLNNNGVENELLFANEIIKTDSHFRDAKVDIVLTTSKLKEKIDFNKKKIYILQGFIASNENNEPTTLGREGSDYTAAIVANICNATELTLWKDVAGIYNADPKLVNDAIKLEKISFREASELAYFGAKVIHQKTAKPLMLKDITLKIRSFQDYNETGTLVANFANKIEPLVPISIIKKNQILLTISSKEFEFINEKIIERIFSILNKFKIKINLMQNSALNLSLCFDQSPNSINNLLQEIDAEFNYKYNTDLTLVTIRYYDKKTIETLTQNKKIKLEQKNRINAFYLLEN